MMMKLTINPLKETELILYGGEFYNGNKVRCLEQFSILFLITLCHYDLIHVLDQIALIFY